MLKNPNPNKVYIVNLENHNLGGSHWCLYGLNHYYSDSYGEMPTAAISKCVTKYNHEDYQGMTDEDCGYFAMYSADMMLNGLPPHLGLVPGKFAQNKQVLRDHFFP